MKVGVFDSGLGGITVLKKLLDAYPNNQYIYYADLKNMPYGSKSNFELITIAENIIKKLEKYDIDRYVCACGTLSSVAIDHMQELLSKKNKKITGIIEPIVDSVRSYDSKNILLIATEATINKKAIENKIKSVCKNSNVYSKACPEFVEAIEKHSNDKTLLYSLTLKYLGEYRNKVDLVICGCTHYILFGQYIKQILGDVQIIEAGQSVVDSLKNDTNFIQKDRISHQKSVKIIVSKQEPLFKKNVANILGTDNFEVYLD